MNEIHVDLMYRKPFHRIESNETEFVFNCFLSISLRGQRFDSIVFRVLFSSFLFDYESSASSLTPCPCRFDSFGCQNANERHFNGTDTIEIANHKLPNHIQCIISISQHFFCSIFRRFPCEFHAQSRDGLETSSGDAQQFNEIQLIR